MGCSKGCSVLTVLPCSLGARCVTASLQGWRNEHVLFFKALNWAWAPIFLLEVSVPPLSIIHSPGLAPSGLTPFGFWGTQICSIQKPFLAIRDVLSCFRYSYSYSLVLKLLHFNCEWWQTNEAWRKVRQCTTEEGPGHSLGRAAASTSYFCIK